MKTLGKVIIATLLMLVAAIFSAAVFATVGIPAEFTFIVSLAVSIILLFVKLPRSNMAYAVTVELWVKYIIDNLFKGNEFLNLCFDEDDYVLGGGVVHIPQAGAKPVVVKNRAVFPGVAVRRTDTDITYPLDVYSSDPMHITNAEAKEISYDKIASVLSEMVSTLGDVVADDMLYKWRAELAARIVATTGATGGALSTGATGARKLFTKDQIKRARFLMNKLNIPKVDRKMLLPSEFLDELQSDLDLIKRDAGKELDLKNGVIDRLYGFDILERSDVLVYDNAGTPVAKAPGAATAVSDNLAALAWQRNAVAKAKGSFDFFENLKDALYYGDVYSAEIKVGGRKRRTNGEGVIAIVQAHA